jgi:hypothetical protein
VRGLTLAGLAIVLSGCAGIPHGGPVHVGRQVPAPGGLGDVDVRVLPAAAQPGLLPTDVVRGFLRAVVNADGNYDIARTYLTRRAAAGWRAGESLTTYDDSGVDIRLASHSPTARSLQLRAPRIGVIDARGDFTPRGGDVRATFGVVRQDGEWRIDRLADGVLLSTFDAQRAFRPALVYYLNRSGTTLVPEQVLLPPTPGSATALVRSLLTGPGAWLAPSVHSAFPEKTELLGNVPIAADGTAEVNFSAAVRQASQSELKALSAQLVWTLRQISEIKRVHVLADGSALVISGASADQPTSAWPTYNPAAPPATGVGAFVRAGRWRTVGGSLPGLARTARGSSSIAISHDSSTVAGLRSDRHGVALVIGRRGGAPTTRLNADAMTAPTFDPAGAVFTVATRGGVRTIGALPAAGGHAVHVTADQSLLDRPVQQLRLSRDGERVAAVVGRIGHGRLLVGRVTTSRTGTQFGAFRNVLPDATDVRGLAWDGGDQLVVTAADAVGGRELVEVDVDGYSTRTVPTSGLVGQPVDVAAAPGRPLLVVAGRSVWRNKPTGGWSRVGVGDQPIYAD